MIIKTFTEESSAAALKRVRQEMGGEAVVLKTRKVTGVNQKPMVEVTACLEKPSVARASDILVDVTGEKREVKPTAPQRPPEQGKTKAPETRPKKTGDELDERIASIDKKLNQLINLGIQPDGISRLEMFQTVHRRLKEADLPDDYLEIFISNLVKDYDGKTGIDAYAHSCLAREMESLIDEPLNLEPGDKIIFIGPAGGGKSSVMGKLAASLTAKSRMKVKLLSLDDYKMAAFDEICSYAEILGLEVVPPPSAETAPPRDDDAVTLIDAPALPTKRDRIEALKAKIDDVKPRYRFAVFSCLTRSRDVFLISRMLKELNPTHLVLTMADLAGRLGTAVTAAKATGLKISYLSDSPGGMGELTRPDADTLAARLLSDEVTCG